MMHGDLDFINKHGVRWTVHINGGHVTIRLSGQKPYEAEQLEDNLRMEFLSKLAKALEVLERK